MMLNISFLLLSSLAFITAFQQQGQQLQHNGAASLFRSSRPSSLKSSPPPPLAATATASLTSLSSSSAFFATDDDDNNTNDDVIAVGSSLSLTARTIRNYLRKVTGFSLTVFRKTLRGITGISLTAVYATAFAATSLWIRKTMSLFLKLFPPGFRYFLQPFLILYYTPLILLRTVTSRTSRKRAVDKHNTVIDAWKEAVTVAERLEKDGYSPVSVNDDGYFELAAPPSLSIDDDSNDNNNNDNRNEEMADAMAAVIEIKNADDEEKNADDEEKK